MIRKPPDTSRESSTALRRFRPRLALTLVCVLALFSSWTATAQEGAPTADDELFARSFQFYPADTGMMTVFNATIEAGESADLTVLIGNSGDVTQDLRIYTVNVFTGEGGGMAAADYGTPPNQVAGWVGLADEVLTLDPGVGYERVFSVSVPEGTGPGEYIGAVAAEHADAYDVEGVDTIRQKTRFVIPIMITVPGEMNAAFSFGEPTLEVTDDVLLLRIPVNNDGDMHVMPSGELTLRDRDGNTIATAPIAMQTVYARESTTLTFGIPGGLPAAAYQIEGSFNDERTGAFARIGPGVFQAEVAATPEPDQFRIAAASITAGPSDDSVQFVTVTAGIVNQGDSAVGMQLSLIAFLDGEEVERFPINQSLSLPTGDTPITARYIPSTGFTTGSWTFELVLETVTPNGTAVVVARASLEGTIEVSD